MTRARSQTVAPDDDRPFDADEEIIIRLVVKFIVDKISDDAAGAQAAARETSSGAAQTEIVSGDANDSTPLVRRSRRRLEPR